MITWKPCTPPLTVEMFDEKSTIHLILVKKDRIFEEEEEDMDSTKIVKWHEADLHRTGGRYQ